METVLTPRMTDEMYVAHIHEWLKLNINGTFKQKQLMNRENADLHLAHFRAKYDHRIIHVYINKQRHFHVQLWNAKDSATFYETFVPGINMTAISQTNFKNAKDDMRDYVYSNHVNEDLFVLRKTKKS